MALTARGMTRGAVQGAALALRAGEVLGPAGLMGSGRTELARMLAGIDRPEAGAMELPGEPHAPRSVAEAMASGVAYVSQEREGLGLHQGFSAADDVALPSLARIARRGIVRHRAVGEFTGARPERLGVRAASTAVSDRGDGAGPGRRDGSRSGRERGGAPRDSVQRGRVMGAA